MSSVYSEIILDHYRNPRNYGVLKQATKTAFFYNPLCGDAMKMEVIINDDIVQEVVFSGAGCAISQAAASLLTERIKGRPISSLIKLDESAILEMLKIQLSPIRLKCALLPLEVLRKILKD